ncbi:prepilin-type N-terminal cleavage/methylation domain-containing protein [Paenibacillus roseipurpureus]|uniref:Prepilin-type N-terminal cleavage/methylation domain-containing protein n=1 Tax=Paenibacillus roseopurpureus TaxID=2918901 RepID=A0AA96RKS6_9BACL|nr:prepilin-type N-terminal cleavage/methylation domain-containing protein [Paenibacillus sp. MBLB1832]WNR42382.1 prepilin-type N-terminal cleavage/methylation domain-containing protein [Paenibacillus sp. MBLB1832]
MTLVLNASQHKVSLQDGLHNQTKRRGGNAMQELVLDNNKKMGFRFPTFKKFSLKELNKNQKGLTLIELLAVIVIIAIIAAIAIPSIGGILKNTRVSAHKSNAHMIIDSTRTMITGEGIIPSATKDTWTLKELHDGGFLETIPKDPSDKTNPYNETTSLVKVTPDATTGNNKYTITLVGTNGVSHITAQDEDKVDTLKFGTTAADVQE